VLIVLSADKFIKLWVFLLFDYSFNSFLQIVRPGGMERPTDAYKETHNIALSQEDTLFGGQVSNLQVFFLYIFFEFAIKL
jgi:hypothetical protein